MKKSKILSVFLAVLIGFYPVLSAPNAVAVQPQLPGEQSGSENAPVTGPDDLAASNTVDATKPVNETTNDFLANANPLSKSNDEETILAAGKPGGGGSGSDTTAPAISRITSTKVTASTALIQWNTNEKATTQVEYGTTTSYGLLSPLNTSLVTKHAVTLSGLAAVTTYHYRVKTCDGANNCTTGTDYTFKTLTDDVTAPVISAVTTSGITATQATVSWQTNELATSQIEYGLTTAYGSVTASDPNLVTSHSQTLTQLQDGSTYHYRTKSCDAANNCSFSGDYSFIAVNPDITPPTISAVLASAIKSSAATLSWTTDELSDSQVEYGLTADYGTLSPLTSTLVTSHSLSLSGLSQDTAYFYRVISRDKAGNVTRSEGSTFRTLVNTAPVVTLNKAAEATFNEGQAFSIVIYGADGENDALTYAAVNKPSNATLTTATDKKSATFSWTPTYTQHGVYAITLTVTDGIETVSVVITLTVNDVNAPPSIGGVKVDQIDGDFDKAGLQVYEASAYHTVTYSMSASDPDGVQFNWSWSYRLNGGEEILLSQGSGTPAKVVMDYSGKPGTYEFIFHGTDDLATVTKYQTTEVISGTWAANNTPSLFLDFDGSFIANWGGYSNITTPYYDQDGDKTSFIDTELANMGAIVKGVIEKFSIFGLFVTALDPFMRLFTGTTYATPTDEFNARSTYYTNNKILVDVIGGNSTWTGGSYGGVAYIDSFTSSIPNYVFAFEDNLGNGNVKYTVEAATHEAGHGFGLDHQSLFSGTTLSQEYNPGTNGIAPIMGVSYYQTRGLWAVGAANCSTCTQDDLAILSKSANSFGYRADEFGNSTDAASAFTDVSGTAMNAYGVINNQSDADFLKFTLASAGQVSFQATGAPVTRMLDIKLELYDALGNLLTTVDPTSSFDATLTMSLGIGTYYLAVKGHGLIDLGGQYGKYYDVGQYWIKGTVPAGTTTGGMAAASSGSQTSGSGTDSGTLNYQTVSKLSRDLAAEINPQEISQETEKRPPSEETGIQNAINRPVAQFKTTKRLDVLQGVLVRQAAQAQSVLARKEEKLAGKKVKADTQRVIAESRKNTGIRDNENVRKLLNFQVAVNVPSPRIKALPSNHVMASSVFLNKLITFNDNLLS